MSEEVPFFSNQEEAVDKVDHRIFFSLIERAGSAGNYQKLLLAIFCLISYLTGGIMLIAPYLFFQDPYQCSQTPSGTSCYDYVCTLPLQDRASFIPSPTIFSLANEFGDFRCDDEKFKLDSIISLMYLGKGAGPFVVTLIGDFVGRKRLILGNAFLFLTGLLLTVFSVNLVMAGIGLFIGLSGLQNAFNIEFNFIAEQVSESCREEYSVVVQLFFGLGVLLNVLWAYLVGDWKIMLLAFYLIPAIITIICIIFVVQDTPICLVMRYTASEALQAFKKIAKINKTQSFQLSVSDIEETNLIYKKRLDSEVHEKSKKFSVLDLFRFRSVLVITLIGIILHMVMIFQFYAPALMLEQFKLNIFVNGLVIGVSEFFAYPLCYFIISRMKRRMIAYVCFAVTYLCSVVMIFLWKQGNEETPDIGSSIGLLALIFVSRYAITVQYTIFYVYMNQLYPTQVRVLGAGLLCTVAGFFSTLVPETIDLCIDNNISIMSLFAVMSGLSFFLSKFLPETYKVPPADEIEQLRVLGERSRNDAKLRMSKGEIKRESLLSRDTLSSQAKGVAF